VLVCSIVAGNLLQVVVSLVLTAHTTSFSQIHHAPCTVAPFLCVAAFSHALFLILPSLSPLHSALQG
jgi:hypothetical protein